MAEMINGNGLWKAIAVALMTAILAIVTTTWVMWPRDAATGIDLRSLRDDLSTTRSDLQKLAIEVAGLSERVRIMQVERSLLPR